MPSKADMQTRHFRRRALRRYGVEVTPQDIAKAVKSIQAGEAVHVARQSGRVSIFDVEVGETVMRVVYDKRNKTLASALELEWWEPTADCV